MKEILYWFRFYKVLQKAPKKELLNKKYLYKKQVNGIRIFKFFPKKPIIKFSEEYQNYIFSGYKLKRS